MGGREDAFNLLTFDKIGYYEIEGQIFIIDMKFCQIYFDYGRMV